MDALNSEMGVCSNLKTGELGFTGFSIAHILIIIIIIIINVIIFNWKYTLTATRTSGIFCFLPLTQCEFFYSFFLNFQTCRHFGTAFVFVFSRKPLRNKGALTSRHNKPIISWWRKLRNTWFYMKRLKECGVLEIFLTIQKLKELSRYNMPIRCVSFRCKKTGDPKKGISMHSGFQFLILSLLTSHMSLPISWSVERVCQRNLDLQQSFHLYTSNKS